MLRDRTDQQIVACLVEDGRATFAEIGGAVGLSAPAVKRRVDRLVAEGTISGFTAVVDPAAFGSSLEAFVELHCQGSSSPEAIRDLVRPYSAIVGAYTVSGDADALLHVRCADVAALESTLESIRHNALVARTTTVIVLSRLLERPQ